MRPKLVLLGDSITEESFGDGGWGAALANHFARQADVVLRGYSGYNTRWALRAVATAMAGVEAPTPRMVTVFFGANDACHPDRASAFQHVPIEEYHGNLRAICSYLKQRWPETLVILITPPPIDEDGRLRFPFSEDPSGLPERTNHYAGAYAKACVAVAKESEVAVIDLWSKMQTYPGWEKALLRDGLHFTASGNKFLFEELVAKLEDEGVSQHTLLADLPLYTDINHADPLKSFPTAT